MAGAKTFVRLTSLTLRALDNNDGAAEVADAATAGGNEMGDGLSMCVAMLDSLSDTAVFLLAGLRGR